MTPSEYARLTPFQIWDLLRGFDDPKSEEGRKIAEKLEDDRREVGANFEGRVEQVNLFD